MPASRLIRRLACTALVGLVVAVPTLRVHAAINPAVAAAVHAARGANLQPGDLPAGFWLAADETLSGPDAAANNVGFWDHSRLRWSALSYRFYTAPGWFQDGTGQVAAVVLAFPSAQAAEAALPALPAEILSGRRASVAAPRIGDHAALATRTYTDGARAHRAYVLTFRRGAFDVAVVVDGDARRLNPTGLDRLGALIDARVTAGTAQSTGA